MPNDERMERLKRTISILLFATFVFLTAIISLCTILLPSYSEYLEDVFEALTWVAEIFQPSTPFHRHRSPTPTQPPIVEGPEELPPLVTCQGIINFLDIIPYLILSLSHHHVLINNIGINHLWITQWPRI